MHLYPMSVRTAARVGKKANTEKGIKMNKNGYYTVNIEVSGQVMPYTVFAQSEYQAARKVREETGYLARDYQVEGPRPQL